MIKLAKHYNDYDIVNFISVLRVSNIAPSIVSDNRKMKFNVQKSFSADQVSDKPFLYS